MRKLILYIERCLDCVYLDQDPSPGATPDDWWCILAGPEQPDIKDVYRIPDWCPLEEAE